MVIKNELPAGTHCGIVCGSFLRTGKSMGESLVTFERSIKDENAGVGRFNGAHGVTRPTRYAPG
jgi:hypothetical protein